MQVLGKNWNGRQSSVGKISKLVSLLLLLLLMLYCSPQLFQTLFIFCHLQLSSLIALDLDWRVLACIGGWEWGATDVVRLSTFWWIATTTNAQIRNAKCHSSRPKELIFKIKIKGHFTKVVQFYQISKLCELSLHTFNQLLVADNLRGEERGKPAGQTEKSYQVCKQKQKWKWERNLK